MIAVSFDQTFEDWRDTARALLSSDVRPEEIVWDGGLFAAPVPEGTTKQRVPKDFVDLARMLATHRDTRKWALLYRVLYRLTHGEPHLLKMEVDPDVHELLLMRKSITHDIHQMHAFVRFRECQQEFIAWYQPDHLILPLTAPWFVNRFANMRWSILTPDGCAYWDQKELRYGPGVPRSQAPAADALEDLWRAYYASTFNPARVNLSQLSVHMPQRRWNTMPETSIINSLVRNAGSRECLMLDEPSLSAFPFIPQDASLPVLAEAVHQCRGCELWEHATQPVFGVGPSDARIVCVGEQPGDNEDREGKPFVGPAGQLFDRALSDAGLVREHLYITGAVKHFRFEQRGKVRIHKTASKAQVAACQPWLEAELNLIRPRIVVCLGNTAALSVIGRGVRVLEDRGRILPHRSADGALITVHPAFLLRMPDESRRNEEYARFVADLKVCRQFSEEQALRKAG